MIQEFDIWAASSSATNPFSDLQGSVLAIEASFYLERLLTQAPFKEPLLSALGGVPFALKAHIQNELEVLRNADITPLFVFGGMNAAEKDRPFRQLDNAVRLNSNAWQLYDEHQAQRAVDTFGSSGYAQPEDYYRVLQIILHEHKIDFQIAPYGAWAQLAYLVQSNDYADAIAGSSELLLFDVGKVITKLNFDRSQFTFVKRQSCMEDLGQISQEMFIDACILSGTVMLPTLPVIGNVSGRPLKIRAAVELMKRQAVQTGNAVCVAFSEKNDLRKPNYLDLFQKSRLAIKHSIVLTSTGKVEPLDHANVPSDLHSIVGQRLPDELYYYLSVGLVGPRVLNQLTSMNIYECAPVDGGDSEQYHSLVRDKLTSLRATALSLLSHSLTRAYSHRKVVLRCWFESEPSTTISLTDYPRPDHVLQDWNVHEDVLKSSSRYQEDNNSFSVALQMLSDPNFAVNTVTPRAKDLSTVLSTKEEIKSNSIWRFLHLRGYINEQHALTPWGKVLDVIVSDPTLVSQDASNHFQEAGLLAVELMRLDLLNSDNMFPTYTGSPMRGSETDKRNCLLLSRIACLSKLHHNAIGFTGPLSRHLLGYNSMISAVRRNLRDVLEMTLVTLLLNGDADREKVDLTAIGLDLPFLLPTDCSVGIAMKHYLDEIAFYPDPTSEATKQAALEKGPKDWFPHSENFQRDLESAFTLWDAVFAGVKVAAETGLVGKGVGSQWEGANNWVKGRRPSKSG